MSEVSERGQDTEEAINIENPQRKREDLPEVAASSNRIRMGQFYRSVIGLSAFFLILILSPLYQVHNHSLLIFVLFTGLIILTDTFLTIEVAPSRFLLFSSLWFFIAYILEGAVFAAGVQSLGFIGAQILSVLLLRKSRQLRPLFYIFNFGQFVLSSLIAGLLPVALGEHGYFQAPTSYLAPFFFVIGYLILNILLTSIAVFLNKGYGEVRNFLWPRISLWTALTFTVTSPAAFIFSFVLKLFSQNDQDILPYLVIGLAICAGILLSIYIMVQLNVRAKTNSILVEQQNKALRTVAEVGRVLSLNLDQESLFRAIYRECSLAMPTDAFYIALYDQEHDKLSFEFLMDNGVLYPRREGNLNQGLAAQVIRQQEAIIQTNVTEVTELNQLHFGHYSRKVQAVMAMPMIVSEEILGVISTQSYKAQAFDSTQVEIFTILAGQAASALHNAKLFAREKEAFRSREQFLSLVSHELKSPLTAISGYSQLARRRLDEQSDPRLERSLTIIEEKTEQLRRLVDDLLDLSRAETGQLQINTEPTDLLKHLRRAIEQWRLNNQHSITLEGELPKMITVLVDPLRLDQVLGNLMSNALKYSPNGGEITLRVAIEKSGEKELKAREVQVSITDEGIGIPAEHVEGLFARFNRAGIESRHKIEGLGLGLSITREIVRAHGGRIWVKSVENAGSTFYFTLPLISLEQ